MEKQESGGREGKMDDGGRDVGMNRGRTRSDEQRMRDKQMEGWREGGMRDERREGWRDN